MKQTYHKRGDDVYQTRAQGAFGGGNRVVDRHQMFENQAQGLQKASHERMLNDRGRKIIKERVGNGNQANFDHYKNMRSSDAQAFDEDWNRVANQLGFNPGSNMLEYGGGRNPYPQQNRGQGARQQQRLGGNAGLAESRGLGMPEGYADSNAEARGLGYVDNSRRGHFIPEQARG